MAIYRLAITEVTRYGDLYCVAGWDLDRRAMVRPEPPGATNANPPSRFWSSQYAGAGKAFEVGNVVRLGDAGLPPMDFPWPHRTEDVIVVGGSSINIEGAVGEEELAQAVQGSVEPTVRAVFDQGLVRAWNGAGSTKAYVVEGHQGRSLGAVELLPNRIRFVEDAFNPAKPQLRAHLQDGLVTYNFSVTSDVLKGLWKAQGLDAVKALRDDCEKVHVRVGLARPFEYQPTRCYAQVNGMYFL